MEPSAPISARRRAVTECPFCGSEAAVNFVVDQGRKWGRAVCADCRASGPEVRTNYDISERAEWHKDAVEAWNARPREDALLAVYRAAKALLDADAANKQNAFGKAWRAMREAVAKVEE
jgi:Lar family restriction alleviation protein